jgi:hypothetical protein
LCQVDARRRAKSRHAFACPTSRRLEARAADRCPEDYRIGGIDGLTLHHLYRAMAWLREELPAKDQDGRTLFAPRCT